MYIPTGFANPGEVWRFRYRMRIWLPEWTAGIVRNTLKLALRAEKRFKVVSVSEIRNREFSIKIRVTTNPVPIKLALIATALTGVFGAVLVTLVGVDRVRDVGIVAILLVVGLLFLVREIKK